MNVEDLERELGCAQEQIEQLRRERDWALEVVVEWCGGTAEEALAAARTEIARDLPMDLGPCTGDGDCSASPHIHGCYADRGDCDRPGEHGVAAG